MLTTNLSTRPFYNVTIVRAALGLFGLLVAAVSVFNILQVTSLSGRERTLSARATASLAEAGRLRADAQRIRAQVDPKELEIVSAAAREANQVIEQKAFSWGSLLSQLEATLPDDVRVTSIQPRVEDGVITVSINVEAMTIGHLAQFMDALEESGAFRNVLDKSHQTSEDATIQAAVEGIYVAPPTGAAGVGKPVRTTGAGNRETHD